ncbi:MAG TPA: tetratricopeptide repeat protein [Anaerolineales bacterium]|nr:tetratricopeptide repeat protein [Anaerolineales bacterium]
MSTPESIDRYRIERRIGHGGMAVIYQALDPTMKRTVAIKLLPRQLLDDESFAMRFQREVETLAALEHPAIVPIYDYGEFEGQPYYVMRYMPGGSLVERLRHGILAVAETGAVVRRIAPALDAAHRKGIVHRDIKPGNILFDSDGRAYLSDFGIVKTASSGLETVDGAVMGTPSYMSPELARGDADIDGRSDIYALGVLLFRAWAGVTPFSANTPMGIAMKHVTEPVPDLLSFQPGLPPACGRLIRTAMAKDRSERFYTAQQLSAVLDRIEAGADWHPEMLEDTVSDLGAALPEESEPRGDVPPTNLPAQSTSFIGRREELARLAECFAAPDCRLVTLLGTGGIGKTRLAIEAAGRTLSDFRHGVFFVPLAALENGERIAPAIADHIGFRFYGQEDQTTQLFNYLRGKQILLVLDNFEHILENADLLTHLLAAAPEVKLLVTARQRLNLQEEWIVLVHGMEVPGSNRPEDPLAFPALELFLARVRRTNPEVTLSESETPYAVRICQLIEGSPLGIELAAAWTRFLSLAEIASEIETSLDFLTSSLRNVAPRHRSLRAVFNYSWELLDAAERQVFIKLALFRGGFTRTSAARVTGAGLADLAGLADKSLLNKSADGRYEMPEVVRQYAFEKLSTDLPTLDALQARHAGHFLGFMTDLRKDLEGDNQLTALEALRSEGENIRLSWKWAVKNRRFGDLAAAHKSLYRYLEFRGRLTEGMETFADLAARLRETEPVHPDETLLLVNSEAREAAFHYRLGRPEPARFLLERSINTLRQSGAAEDLGFALTYLGAVKYLAGDLTGAADHLEESITTLRNTPDRIGFAVAHHHLALVARQRDDLDEARQLFSESLRVNREIGNEFGEAIALNNLGLIAQQTGNYAEAFDLHNKSLAIRERLEDRWGIANVFDGLGLVAFERGDYLQAESYFEESAAIYREVGDDRRAATADFNLARTAEILAGREPD